MASYFGNRFNKTLHDTPAELQRLRGVAVAFGRYYDRMRANIDVQLSPTAPEVTAQRTAARLAAVAIASEKFQDFIVGTHLTQVFAHAQDTITRGAARAACSALILHSTVMLEISVLTGGLASAAGRSVVALGLPELPALVGVVRGGVECKTPADALARFAEYEARLTHEQAMLAHEATLTAGGHGRLREADVKMLEAGNAAARAEMQGTHAQQAKLRMAGLEADNTAGTLWTVAQGDAPTVMARLKAAGFRVTADASNASAAPAEGSALAGRASASGTRAAAADISSTLPTRWFVDFGGQRVEVTAVDRPSSVRNESVSTDVVHPSPHPVESTRPTRVIPADVAVEFKAILGFRYDGLMESARILIADPTIGPLLASHTTEEVAAMIGYTKFEYMQLNTALRSGDAVELRRLKPLIEHTNQGLAKLPNYVGPVYRGAALSAAQIAKYNVGTVVTEPAFTSTSTHSDSKFPGNVEFVIDSKTGTRIDFLSAFGHEKEVLFQSGTQFIVVDVIIFGKTTQITMMEVS